jgi:hypothetical protein
MTRNIAYVQYHSRYSSQNFKGKGHLTPQLAQSPKWTFEFTGPNTDDPLLKHMHEFSLKIFYGGFCHLWLYIFSKIKVYWNVWVFDYFQGKGHLTPQLAQSPKWTFEFTGPNQIPAIYFYIVRNKKLKIFSGLNK